MAVMIVALFGAFSLIGGIIGYVKAKSAASLVAGAVSGVGLLLCAYGLGQGSRPAAISSLVIALLLGGRFFGTWRRNHRVMPDLLMVLLSLATLLAVGDWLISSNSAWASEETPPPTCGGFVGKGCPEGLRCVTPLEVADAEGICVPADASAAEIQQIAHELDEFHRRQTKEHLESMYEYYQRQVEEGPPELADENRRQAEQVLEWLREAEENGDEDEEAAD